MWADKLEVVDKPFPVNKNLTTLGGADRQNVPVSTRLV